MEQKSFNITLSVSEPTHDILRKLAKENYRTIKAQAEMILVDGLHQLAVKKVKSEPTQTNEE